VIFIEGGRFPVLFGQSVGTQKERDRLIREFGKNVLEENDDLLQFDGFRDAGTEQARDAVHRVVPARFVGLIREPDAFGIEMSVFVEDKDEQFAEQIDFQRFSVGLQPALFGRI